MHQQSSSVLGALAVVFLLGQTAIAQERERLEFTRLIAHWDAYGDRDAYLSFVTDAQPEVAQVGFYGAHFWSLAHTEHGKGYPAHFPVRGLKECGEWFENLNGDLRSNRVKVVGHFNVKFLVGDPDSPEGPRGFFKFYRDLWDEAELGKKPVADPLDLLEKNADGTPITNANYSIGGMKEYWGCLNNPHWRSVLKAWAKRGIQRGVDGYVLNYFYRHNCLCEHCQSAFKAHLRENYPPAELKQKFALEDLDEHHFPEIVSWHKPAESTPLRREMLRFSQIANKRAVDEVFVQYARQLKPSLYVAQWNHLGDFHQLSGDERCLLPAELWGRDEDYLWYSTGDSANSTELSAGFLGDATLQSRYIRGAFDDKPFTLGKYESTRIRAAIAELAANGGAPMGFYTRFTDPAARAEIVRYYQFIAKHDALFRANLPHAEVLLLYPRSDVHQGKLQSLERFKQLGKKLLDAHVLFDVRPDDLASTELRKRYTLVVDPSQESDAIDLTFARSKFAAANTIQISASRPAQRTALHLHFVNYNRDEPAGKRSPGGGIADERPIITTEFASEVLVPSTWKRIQATFLTPESADAASLEVQVTEGVARFQVPPFLVYGIVELRPE